MKLGMNEHHASRGPSNLALPVPNHKQYQNATMDTWCG